MFTGIVEELGVVQALKRSSQTTVLSIKGNTIFDDLSLGDSVAVNGVCLTVSQLAEKRFGADVMNETLARSSLGNLSQGASVNLERALPANGRFGGHIVSGHIDGTGMIVSIEHDSNAIWYEVAAPEHIMRYVVEKGSIAIDGISLTVAAVSTDRFKVSVIPHTAANTVMSERHIGSAVNLENDIIGKYVEKLLQPAMHQGVAHSTPKGISIDFLAEHGF